MLPFGGCSLSDSRVQLEVFEGNWVANKGFTTPYRGRVYLWPLVRIITRESLARVEIP